jgi:wobble nucleotide-excising tRNase
MPLPHLPVGQTVEVILMVPESESIDRQTFLQLSIEERRRILSKQVEAMKEYYQEDPDWQDWVNFDNGETDDYSGSQIGEVRCGGETITTQGSMYTSSLREPL